MWDRGLVMNMTDNNYSIPPAASAGQKPVVPGWLAIGAGLAMVVGSFLPWVSASAPFVGSFTRSGVDGGGDGILSVVVGAAVACFGLVMLRGSANGFVKASVLVAGVVALLFVLYESGVVRDRISDAEAQSDLIVATVGSGLYLIGAAAVAAVVAGLLAFRD